MLPSAIQPLDGGANSLMEEIGLMLIPSSSPPYHVFSLEENKDSPDSF